MEIGLSGFDFVKRGLEQIRHVEGRPVVTVDVGAVTFEVAADRYSEDKRARVGRGTYENWRRALARVEPELRGKVLAAVTPLDIHAAYLAVSRRWPSPWLLNATRAALRELWGWAIEMGCAVKCPVGPKSWRHSKQEVAVRRHVFTPAEEKRILELVPPKVGMTFVVALNTALRLGDIRIARREWLGGDWWLRFPPGVRKNKAAHAIFLNRRARLNIPKEGGPLLWPGVPSRGYISRCLHAAAVEMGCPHEDFSLTSARDTCVSRLHEAGGSSAEVQKLLGWHNEEVFRRHYVQVPAKRAQEMLEEAGR